MKLPKDCSHATEGKWREKASGTHFSKYKTSQAGGTTIGITQEHITRELPSTMTSYIPDIHF
jgi:hypothetical protein